MIDPTLATWAFAYDSEGLMTSRTEPLGRTTTYQYPAARGRRRGNVAEVVVQADSLGANGSGDRLITKIYYDLITNQPVEIESPKKVVTAILRDGATGLATKITRAVGTSELSVVELPLTEHYLRTGQPTRVINPNGHETRSTYFPAGSSSHGYLKVPRTLTGEKG